MEVARHVDVATSKPNLLGRLPQCGVDQGLAGVLGTPREAELTGVGAQVPAAAGDDHLQFVVGGGRQHGQDRRRRPYVGDVDW